MLDAGVPSSQQGPPPHPHTGPTPWFEKPGRISHSLTYWNGFKNCSLTEKNSINKKAPPCEQKLRPLSSSPDRVPCSRGNVAEGPNHGRWGWGLLPWSGRYLVELGLTGEGRRGQDSALLACPRIASTLQEEEGGSRGVEAASAARSPFRAARSPQQSSWPRGNATPAVYAGGGRGRGGPPQGGRGIAYRSSSLGPLGSDQGLQAAAASLVLPRTGVFELAGSVKLPPNLDALLGAPWEEMLTGPCSAALQAQASPAGHREAAHSTACSSVSPNHPSQVWGRSPGHRTLLCSGPVLGEACPPRISEGDLIWK